MPSEAAIKGAEQSFLSQPGFVADLFPGTAEQWVQYHRTYIVCEASIIDDAAEERYKPLVDAVQEMLDGHDRSVGFIGCSRLAVREALVKVQKKSEMPGKVPECVLGWIGGGKYYCSKNCAGGGIPFAFVPYGSRCTNCKHLI